ncbi:hypothetical protein J1614_007239 [Plenodomus biglobosus]|nr:hypothetical protein J1614_007239 [Plenodomus biglobosus]
MIHEVLLKDVNIHIIDNVHRTNARMFPLCSLLSPERQLLLHFEIKPQHVEFSMLVAHLSQPKIQEWYTPGNSEILDAVTSRPITSDDDLAAAVNSHINVRKLEGVALEFRTPGKPIQSDTILQYTQLLSCHVLTRNYNPLQEL